MPSKTTRVFRPSLFIWWGGFVISTLMVAVLVVTDLQATGEQTFWDYLSSLLMALLVFGLFILTLAARKTSLIVTDEFVEQTGVRPWKIAKTQISEIQIRPHPEGATVWIRAKDKKPVCPIVQLFLSRKNNDELLALLTHYTKS